MITYIVNQIIVGVNQAKQEVSTIVNFYKGKCDSLEGWNYRRLELTDQILKITEEIMEKLIRQHMDIDEMEVGFMPECGIANAISVLRQLTGEIFSKKREFLLYICGFIENFWSSG